jgi:hypothetical protein
MKYITREERNYCDEKDCPPLQGRGSPRWAASPRKEEKILGTEFYIPPKNLITKKSTKRSEKPNLLFARNSKKRAIMKINATIAEILMSRR